MKDSVWDATKAQTLDKALERLSVRPRECVWGAEWEKVKGMQSAILWDTVWVQQLATALVRFAHKLVGELGTVKELMAALKVAKSVALMAEKWVFQKAAKRVV